ncbi:MAG: DNA repair protein RecN [Hyphomicrobiales bacterium]|nr:DNA repair protein RecN [Hyphomicrobiales bacterium]
MLIRLCVRDIVLIESAEVELSAGLSVLTGETGAGKSILLDALGLALGQRGDAALVRAGASEGSVTAFFSIPPEHAACALASQSGITQEPGEPLILRRVQEKTGATRAFLNDQPVSVALLREIGENLVDVLGQHEVRGLLDPKRHRNALDAFGALDKHIRRTRNAFVPMRDLRAAIEARGGEGGSKLEAEITELDAHLEELENFAPVAGEEESLARERSLLMRAAEVGDEISATAQTLNDADEGLEARLGALLRRLARLSARMGEESHLETAASALERALPEVSEARASMDSLLEALDADPERLEAAESRLFALRGLSRKHEVDCDELPALQERLRERRDGLREALSREGTLQADYAAACKKYEQAANALSKARADAAKRLDNTVTSELKALRLAHIAFRTGVERVEANASPEGRDKVGFEVAPESGEAFGALGRIASGGELSRFMLALQAAIVGRKKSVAAQGPVCLIFDEIDQGVGGAVADAVGARLQRLAKTAQVLVVTHAPQIAARATSHFLVSRSKPQSKKPPPKSKSKTSRRDIAVAGISRLQAAARREEIARMLAGAVISTEARAAAARLLKENLDS